MLPKLSAYFRIKVDHAQVEFPLGAGLDRIIRFAGQGCRDEGVPWSVIVEIRITDDKQAPLAPIGTADLEMSIAPVMFNIVLERGQFDELARDVLGHPGIPLNVTFKLGGPLVEGMTEVSGGQVRFDSPRTAEAG